MANKLFPWLEDDNSMLSGSNISTNRPFIGRKLLTPYDYLQSILNEPTHDETSTEDNQNKLSGNTEKPKQNNLFSSISALNRWTGQTVDKLLPDNITPKPMQKAIDHYKNQGLQKITTHEPHAPEGPQQGGAVPNLMEMYADPNYKLSSVDKVLAEKFVDTFKNNYTTKNIIGIKQQPNTREMAKNPQYSNILLMESKIDPIKQFGAGFVSSFGEKPKVEALDSLTGSTQNSENFNNLQKSTQGKSTPSAAAGKVALKQTVSLPAESAIKEYDRLAEVIGDESLIPKEAPKTIDIDTIKYVLNEDDYNTYANKKHLFTYELVSQFIKTNDYLNMNDVQRLAAIKQISNYADYKAKKYVKPNIMKNIDNYIQDNRINSSSGNLISNAENLLDNIVNKPSQDLKDWHNSDYRKQQLANFEATQMDMCPGYYNGGYNDNTYKNISTKETDNTSYNITLEAALDNQMQQSPKTLKNGKWVNASKDEVQQYLDPRNYNEGVYKYQFLDLSASAGISVEDMAKYLAGKGVLAGKESIYLEAAKKYNVSEVYLAAHSALETGNGTSELAKGVVVNGVIVYNMYGICAYDSDPVSAGAQYAYKMGWTTPEKAIEGGAKWISEQYINNSLYRQNTLYKMRWNPASSGMHQYATGIGWAVQQTPSIMKMYDNFENASLKFDIPTYK